LNGPVSTVQAFGKIEQGLRTVSFSQFVSAQVVQDLGSASFANLVSLEIANDFGSGTFTQVKRIESGCFRNQTPLGTRPGRRICQPNRRS
jgi:hypothetical protein